jgi:hypothetical protein
MTTNQEIEMIKMQHTIEIKKLRETNNKLLGEKIELSDKLGCIWGILTSDNETIKKMHLQYPTIIDELIKLSWIKLPEEFNNEQETIQETQETK